MSSRVVEEVTVTTPSSAREVVAGAVSAWHNDELVEIAELMVSELVTNAVRYGQVERVPFYVVADDRSLYVEVSDRSSAGPVVCGGHDDEPGGWGMSIIHEFASRWGYSRGLTSGKSVWFELENATARVTGVSACSWRPPTREGVRASAAHCNIPRG